MPALFLLASGQAATAAPNSWLGHQLDPAQSAFCRTYGCTLQEVRQNEEGGMGWHDGQQRSYRLKDGSLLQVDVRPGGWISNARLLFANHSRMTAADHRQAAEFLSALTGRRFSAAAIAACERAGLALNDPDAYGPVQPLSQWRTPDGLAYKARCGINSQVGVWAGWQQQ